VITGARWADAGNKKETKHGSTANRVPVAQKLPAVIDREHVQALLAKVEPLKYRMVVMTAYGTGLRARWVSARMQRALPVPHFHVVFTLPAELRELVPTRQRSTSCP